MNTVAERLKILRFELGKKAGKVKKTTGEPMALTQDEFASRLGVGGSLISAIENERNDQKLTERLANDICDVYNVNYQWLVDGEDVPMFFDDQTMLDEIAKEYGLNKNERILIEYYLNNPDKREAIVKEIYALAERMDKEKGE